MIGNPDTGPQFRQFPAFPRVTATLLVHIRDIGFDAPRATVFPFLLQKGCAIVRR